MSNSPKILVKDKLKPQDIVITVSESNLHLTEEIESRIEEIWQEKLVESTQRGKIIFNGSSYRLNSWSYQNQKLLLDLSVFDYKHRLGLMTLIRKEEINPEKYNKGGCYVGATVLTSDNKYVMVELSGKSMNYNTYELLGGMAETDVPITSDGQYLFHALQQELLEEAGIETRDVTESYIPLFYWSTNAHYAFHFLITTSVSSQTLQERFASNSDVDISKLHFFTQDEYLNKLHKLNSVKQMIAKELEL